MVLTAARVSALLELGSGFHPEYSGLANIDLAAALLGLMPYEIAAKRDEIIAFADIGEHIHDPIKHYSSGMVVRLGFAVATALAPAIGYDAAAKIAKEALVTGKTIREVAREQTRLAPEELDRLLDPSRMTQPGVEAGPAGG